MPKKETTFDVNQYLKDTNKPKSIEKVAEEVSAEDIEDISQDEEQIVITDRVTNKLVTQEPDPSLVGKWNDENEIDLGQHNAQRMKTARDAEVKRMKAFRLENRKKITEITANIHGESPAEVEKHDNQKILSEKSLIRLREEARSKKKGSIVETMMKDLLGSFRE